MDGPDPLWELVNSLQMLQGRYGQAVFGQWRRLAAGALRQAGLAGVVRALLFPVAPHASYFPDLLTPPEAALGLAEGIDAILHTPRRRLGVEIGRLDGAPGVGAWLADLAAGRADVVTELGDALHAYHRCAVEPYWNQLHVWIDSDVAMRRHTVQAGGVERLLDSFKPLMRWRYPVLELPDHPSNRDVHLDGRGLLLVPSYFCWLHPLTIFDATLPQIVVYPVEHHPAWLSSGPAQTSSAALARLLGDTRAAVLLALRNGCNTSDLAHRVGVSPAAISHHTGVLRDAGLIASRRASNTVLHTLSPLGSALLGQQK